MDIHQAQKRNVRAGFGRLALAAVLATVGTGGLAKAQSTERVSVSSSEVQDNSGASDTSYVTPDGRFVVFTSTADGLVSGDTNGLRDVFVRDRVLGTTRRVSLPDPSMPNTQANSSCFLGRSGNRFCSDDGRHVVFVSSANNLVPGDTNGDQPPWHIDGLDVFVRDRDKDGNGVFDEAGVGKTTTTRVSVNSNENQYTEFFVGVDTYGGACDDPSISANGQYVAFKSQADNLTRGGDQGTIGSNIYWRNRDNDGNGTFDEPGNVCIIILPNGCITAEGGVTELVSKVRCCSGQQFDGSCDRPSISGNGRYVAFDTSSQWLDYDLVTDNDSNQRGDVYVRDMFGSGKSERVSVDSNENQNTDFGSNIAVLSHDGRYVAFSSASTQFLGIGVDSNGFSDIYLRDRGTPSGGNFIHSAGTTQRVSLGTFHPFPSGSPNLFVELNDNSSQPSISPDGRHVAFTTHATNVACGLICTGAAAFDDVYVRDWVAPTSRLISAPDAVFAGDGNSSKGSISQGAEFASFDSVATNMVSPDANGAGSDVYLRTRGGPTLVSAVSRKTHGAAGDFDINLPLSGCPATESRTGGPTRLVLAFNENISAEDGAFNCNDEVTLQFATCGSVSVSGAELTVNLSASTANHIIGVAVKDIKDVNNYPLYGDAEFFLLHTQGDVNADRVVNIVDLNEVKTRLFQVVTVANFRADVNADGVINIVDLNDTKGNLFANLGACP